MFVAARLIPVVISFLLLAAHFLRQDNLVVVGVCLALPAFIFVRRPWVTYLLSLALLLGGIEWLRTLLAIASRRQMIGDPWVRMAAILGVIAALTLFSILVFLNKRVREHFGHESTGGTGV